MIAPEAQSSDFLSASEQRMPAWVLAAIILMASVAAGVLSGVIFSGYQNREETEPAGGSHVDCLSEIPQICDAVRFVEAARGQPFKTFPEIEFLEAEEFLKRVSQLWDEPVDPQEVVDAEAFRVLGLIDASTDVSKVLGGLDTAGILGAYSGVDEALWVRGSDLGVLEVSVLVHELTHALDDQWFDLDAEVFYGNSSDHYNAIAATIEGDAMRVEELWRSTLDANARRTVIEDEFLSLSDEEVATLRAFPPALLEIAGWPYTEGLEFMEYVAEDGGEDAVNELFRNPPASTEQVIHSEALALRERVIGVEPARPDGEVVGEGVLGELVVSLLFGPVAAEGWGGDSFVLYEHDTRICVTVKIVTDTGRDKDELLGATLIWSESDDGGSVRRVSPGDESVTLESCLEADL